MKNMTIKIGKNKTAKNIFIVNMPTENELITQAQATALAESFLDSIGSDKESFQPVELISEVIRIASEFVTIAQANCPVHTGKLASSITANEPAEEGNGIVSVEVLMSIYGQFVDKGVRGTKGGAGLFAFKTDMPSRSMIKAILEYIKTSKLSTHNIKKSISKHETKNLSISKAASAFAMARAIKQHGIKPINFIAKAAQAVDSKYSIALSVALVKDVYNSLPDKI